MYVDSISTFIIFADVLYMIYGGYMSRYLHNKSNIFYIDKEIFSIYVGLYIATINELIYVLYTQSHIQQRQHT